MSGFPSPTGGATTSRADHPGRVTASSLPARTLALTLWPVVFWIGWAVTMAFVRSDLSVLIGRVAFFVVSFLSNVVLTAGHLARLPCRDFDATPRHPTHGKLTCPSGTRRTASSTSRAGLTRAHLPNPEPPAGRAQAVRYAAIRQTNNTRQKIMRAFP
jgi:hypothetical protein